MNPYLKKEVPKYHDDEVEMEELEEVAEFQNEENKEIPEYCRNGPVVSRGMEVLSSGKDFEKRTTFMKDKKLKFENREPINKQGGKFGFLKKKL